LLGRPSMSNVSAADVYLDGGTRSYMRLPFRVRCRGDRKVGQFRLHPLRTRLARSAQRVLRFAFLAEKLSIDTGELTDKGVVSQRNILRRHAALIEKLFADNPDDHVIRLNPALEESLNP
jgi:feruloyl-CoA synthase